jgi:hypothetical protein
MDRNSPRFLELVRKRREETAALAGDRAAAKAERASPPIDWNCDVDSMLKHFGNGTLDKIEKMLGCASPNESVRVDLAIIAWKYATQRSNLAPEKDLRAWSENLQQSLTAALTALNPPSSGDVAGTTWIILKNHNLHAEIDSLKGGIKALLEKTAKISCGSAAPSKGGRPPQTELKVMVGRCAELFRQHHRFPVVNSDFYVRPAHARNSYGGRFFHLVEAVDAAAAQLSRRRPASDASLHGVIKRTVAEITPRKAKPGRT